MTMSILALAASSAALPGLLIWIVDSRQRRTRV
jgi:hypothetical protein